MSVSWKPCVATLATVLAACSPQELRRGTTFSDSAGVTLAFAEAPAWLPGEGWLVTNEPTLQIGALEGPEDYQFTEIVGVVRLGDGRIVVADRGSSEMKVFGPDGGFRARVGRQGEGPGEFRRLEFVGAFSGDSLVTFGTWLGEVGVPRGFDRGIIPYQAPSYQIGADFVLGVWKDDLDVQYVRLYELVKR